MEPNGNAQRFGLNLLIDNTGQVKRNDRTRKEEPFDPSIPPLLPHETMYKIQVGSKLFEISGASLSSDGPSYFTECFSRQGSARKAERDARHSPQVRHRNDGGDFDDDNRDYNDVASAGGTPVISTPSPPRTSGSAENRVLFIDRSADTFELICQHLQGYFVDIKNEVQYTMLYADAMYYNLPRLRCILKEYEYYFTNVSGKTFKISKSLFRRSGDCPNYFTMTFAASYVDFEQFFITKNLIRPPPQSAPYVSRSSEFFQDILDLLGGAEMKLDDEKRSSLIKECKYYRFLNLEQRLIKCWINFNPLTKREDILVSLSDIVKKELEFPKEKVSPGGCPRPTSEAPEDHRSSSDENNQCATGNDSGPESTCESPFSDSQPPAKRLKMGSYEQGKTKDCWQICCYKRPYLDSYCRDLIFQIDSMESVLFFNKKNKTIYVAFINHVAHQFETTFGSVLAKCGIELSNSKITIRHSDELQTQQKNITSLVLPACLSFCDLRVNGASCPNIASIVAEKSSNDHVPDFTNLKELSYCPGKKLYLSKSLWKVGVNNGKIMMIAVKVDTFNGTKDYCRMINYL